MMISEAVNPRCFFDITVGGTKAGRVIFELFADVCPITCENFRALCTGENGIGKSTEKLLHYKGVIFHRVVKNFMIQGGDFSAGNGSGGESIYGGTFKDENFILKHDKPLLLSMANRGKDTNGSQFFITTKPAPHLDNVHIVFGRLVSGKNIINDIENLEVDRNSCPYSEVKIGNCGELVMKVKPKAKKKRRMSASSAGHSSDEDSKEKRKKAKHKKHKEKSGNSDKEDGQIEEEEEADADCSIQPEEIPDIPDNNFLMRRTPPLQQASAYQRVSRAGNRSLNRIMVSRSGRKIKGRGFMRFRTPSRSRSRSRSYTPPHWRAAQSRLVPVNTVDMSKIKSSLIEDNRVEASLQKRGRNQVHERIQRNKQQNDSQTDVDNKDRRRSRRELHPRRGQIQNGKDSEDHKNRNKRELNHQKDISSHDKPKDVRTGNTPERKRASNSRSEGDGRSRSLHEHKGHVHEREDSRKNKRDSLEMRGQHVHRSEKSSEISERRTGDDKRHHHQSKERHRENTRSSRRRSSERGERLRRIQGDSKSRERHEDGHRGDVNDDTKKNDAKEMNVEQKSELIQIPMPFDIPLPDDYPSIQPTSLPQQKKFEDSDSSSLSGHKKTSVNQVEGKKAMAKKHRKKSSSSSSDSESSPKKRQNNRARVERQKETQSTHKEKTKPRSDSSSEDEAKDSRRNKHSSKERLKSTSVGAKQKSRKSSTSPEVSRRHASKEKPQTTRKSQSLSKGRVVRQRSRSPRGNRKRSHSRSVENKQKRNSDRSRSRDADAKHQSPSRKYRRSREKRNRRDSSDDRSHANRRKAKPRRSRSPEKRSRRRSSSSDSDDSKSSSSSD